MVIDIPARHRMEYIYGYIVLKGGKTELDGDVHVLLYHNSRLFETAFSPKLHAEASFASKQRHKGRRVGQFCRPVDCPALVFTD